jgi:predicted PurR-regulated permease PerM
MLMLLSFVVIVVPLSWVVSKLIEEFTPFLQDTSKIQDSIRQIDEYITRRYKVDILTAGSMEKLLGVFASAGSKLVGATLSTLMNLVVMYFILWFMLMNCSEIEKWIRQKIPLKNTNTMQLLRESQHVVLSNTIGIPVLGIIQGIVAMIGYFIFDVEKPILWGIITGIASVIPFVGTMAAWIPLSILTFARGDTNNGYGIFLWGLLVIGSSDNIFRMFLQKYTADIHPLVTVFGVIIGLNMFGFLGLIFGPLLISLFLILVRIYYDEYVNNRQEASEGHDPPHAGSAKESGG